jgi:hypothetical protein
MIHARLLVEREVVQGKRDDEVFNRAFGECEVVHSLSRIKGLPVGDPARMYGIVLVMRRVGLTMVGDGRGDR